MGNTVRTTISIPEDLRARMDAIAEPVNWSAIACKAFESKVSEVLAKKKVRKMTDVINRLRASKRRSGDADYAEGMGHGRRWAMEDAEAAELERLARLRGELRGDWEAVFDMEHDSAYDPSEWFCFAIRPDDESDRAAAAEFWESAVDRKPPRGETPSFVRGFAEGALEVWREVEDEL